MLDPTKVSALLTRVRREVDEGLLPAAQIAIGHEGEVVLDETFGLPPETRFVPFSATKGLIGGALWRLVGDGAIDLTEQVATYLPSFASNGKDVVTVEQVAMHLGGFPMAPLGPGRWDTQESRLRVVRPVAPHAHPGRDVHVPPHRRALGARRDHRRGDRRALRRRRRSAW